MMAHAIRPEGLTNSEYLSNVSIDLCIGACGAGADGLLVAGRGEGLWADEDAVAVDVTIPIVAGDMK